MQKKEDYVAQLSMYIKKNLKKGYTLESLKYALINQGHSRLEVDKAIKKAQEEQSREAPVLETKPTIVYEALDADNVKVEPKGSFWKRLFGIK